MNNNRAYYENLPMESVCCALCGQSDSSTVHNDDRYGMGIRTVHCRQCGLVYVNPRPTASALKSFYANDYRRLYVSIDVPTEDYVKSGALLPRAEASCKRIFRHFSSAEGRDLTALDIGCGEGSFLRKLRQDDRFSTACGLEPNADFARFAASYSGASVFNGTFESFLAQGMGADEGYDLISLNHVLEHLADPAAELRVIRSLLKVDGVFYVEVPNVCSDRGCGLGQFHVAHLYMYYPETFQMMLESNGFKVLELVTSGLPGLCPSMCALVKKGPITEPECGLDPAIARQRIDFIKASVAENPRSMRSRSPARRLRTFFRRLAGS